MSLLTLLSLDNDDIECVTSAVRIWCDQHGAEVDSRAVTKAMSIAIHLCSQARRRRIFWRTHSPVIRRAKRRS